MYFCISIFSTGVIWCGFSLLHVLPMERISAHIDYMCHLCLYCHLCFFWCDPKVVMNLLQHVEMFSNPWSFSSLVLFRSGYAAEFGHLWVQQLFWIHPQTGLHETRGPAFWPICRVHSGWDCSRYSHCEGKGLNITHYSICLTNTHWAENGVLGKQVFHYSLD